MNAPTFLRPELWHPLTIHFPIALLLLATLVKAVALFLAKRHQDFWQKVGTFLLLVGTAGVWLAVYTGDTAEGIVARKICDPLVLKRHETASMTTAWLFTGAVLLVAVHYFRVFLKQEKILRVLTLLVMLAGAGYLIYTSHLGASVVYEQGGGVNIPSADCKGF